MRNRLFFFTHVLVAEYVFSANWQFVSHPSQFIKVRFKTSASYTIIGDREREWSYSIYAKDVFGIYCCVVCACVFCVCEYSEVKVSGIKSARTLSLCYILCISIANIYQHRYVDICMLCFMISQCCASCLIIDCAVLLSASARLLWDNATCICKPLIC